MKYIITICRDEIIHDLDFDTLFLQKVRFLGKEGPLNEHLFSSDESNAYRINRWMNKYINKVQSFLVAYLCADAHKNEACNIPDQWKEFYLNLNMPETWPFALDDLTETIHDYMVNAVEYQFMCLTLGPNDPETQIKYQNLLDDEQEIQKILSKRFNPLKVPFHPF